MCIVGTWASHQCAMIIHFLVFSLVFVPAVVSGYEGGILDLDLNYVALRSFGAAPCDNPAMPRCDVTKGSALLPVLRECEKNVVCFVAKPNVSYAPENFQVGWVVTEADIRRKAEEYYGYVYIGAESGANIDAVILSMDANRVIIGSITTRSLDMTAVGNHIMLTDVKVPATGNRYGIFPRTVSIVVGRCNFFEISNSVLQSVGPFQGIIKLRGSQDLAFSSVRLTNVDIEGGDLTGVLLDKMEIQQGVIRLHTPLRKLSITNTYVGAPYLVDSAVAPISIEDNVTLTGDRVVVSTAKLIVIKDVVVALGEPPTTTSKREANTIFRANSLQCSLILRLSGPSSGSLVHLRKESQANVVAVVSMEDFQLKLPESSDASPLYDVASMANPQFPTIRLAADKWGSPFDATEYEFPPKDAHRCDDLWAGGVANPAFDNQQPRIATALSAAIGAAVGLICVLLGYVGLRLFIGHRSNHLSRPATADSISKPLLNGKDSTKEQEGKGSHQQDPYYIKYMPTTWLDKEADHEGGRVVAQPPIVFNTETSEDSRSAGTSFRKRTAKAAKENLSGSPDARMRVVCASSASGASTPCSNQGADDRCYVGKGQMSRPIGIAGAVDCGGGSADVSGGTTFRSSMFSASDSDEDEE